MEAGTRLVFGYLAGAPAPFDAAHPRNGFILAFQALPLILIMSALSRLLYYWGILQRLVAAFAGLLQRTFGIGGPLGMAAAANVLVGMVEAPLLIRPYLNSMGRGALFATMAAGMATLAGTVLVVYAAILEPHVPGAAGHLIAASLMNAPAALMLSRLAVPEGFQAGPTAAHIELDHQPRSSMDAVVQGTADGVRLLAAVAAMLVVMVALVALANEILGGRLGRLRRAPDAAADPRMAVLSAGVAARHTLGGSWPGRRPDRPESRPQRVPRLSRFRGDGHSGIRAALRA